MTRAYVITESELDREILQKILPESLVNQTKFVAGARPGFNRNNYRSTIIVLEQLQNAAERLRTPYLGLFQLLLRIAEAQPTAPPAMLNSLTQTIGRAQAAADASAASVQEAKRDWNIL